MPGTSQPRRVGKGAILDVDARGQNHATNIETRFYPPYNEPSGGLPNTRSAARWNRTSAVRHHISTMMRTRPNFGAQANKIWHFLHVYVSWRPPKRQLRDMFSCSLFMASARAPDATPPTPPAALASPPPPDRFADTRTSETDTAHLRGRRRGRAGTARRSLSSKVRACRFPSTWFEDPTRAVLAAKRSSTDADVRAHSVSTTAARARSAPSHAHDGCVSKARTRRTKAPSSACCFIEAVDFHDARLHDQRENQ